MATVGKLAELLALETQVDGEPAIVVIPKGVIVEVYTEDDYQDGLEDEAIDEAAKYLKDYDK